MRVLVDTSAWVDFLNGHPSPAADALDALLRGDDDACTCGIVVAESFRGLRARGTTVRSTIECVIAAIAEAEGCGLVEAERWPPPPPGR